MRASAAIIGCVAIGILVACATPPTTPESQLSSPPASKERDHSRFAKVSQQYPSNQFLVGMGEAESDTAATELARADLLKQARVAVKVVWTDLLRERGGHAEQEVSRVLESRVEELVQGVEIVDRGKDPSTGHAYAVAVVPRSEVARILRFSESATTPEESGLQEQLERKEPVWVTSEGVAPFGPDTTLAEAKTRARDEARRKAIEQAVGVFVKGQRVVYNAQVAEDLVHSLVRGIVVEEQILEEGVRQLGQETGAPALLYATKLKAKVKPVRIERRGDFAVKADLNKTVFSEGEEMQIRAVATRDAYLHIFNIGQDDAVTVLLPNRFVHRNVLRAHQELVFPDEEQRSLGIRLRVFPPAGTQKAVEKMKLIATTKPIEFMKGKIQEGVYQVYTGKDTALITDLLRELAHLDESEWAEVTVPYEVRR